VEAHSQCGRAIAVQRSVGGRLPLALISATISLRVIVSSSICRGARSSTRGRLFCVFSPNCEACERDSGGMGCEAVFRRAANIWSLISIARRGYACLVRLTWRSRAGTQFGSSTPEGRMGPRSRPGLHLVAESSLGAQSPTRNGDRYALLTLPMCQCLVALLA
jgi:hypothetical protein